MEKSMERPIGGDALTMKQAERRERTKRLLLEATASLIREKGCAKTSLKDIMERSGLSKGGIFHYVKNKDELFCMVLQEWLEETGRRFCRATMEKEDKFGGPLGEIVARLHELDDPNDVGNQVFLYLLGKNGQDEARDVLRQFYAQSFHTSRQWIVLGQEAGVIPKSVDADKMADLFVLIGLGMRVRSGIGQPFAFESADFAALMAELLQRGESAQRPKKG